MAQARVKVREAGHRKAWDDGVFGIILDVDIEDAGEPIINFGENSDTVNEKFEYLHHIPHIATGRNVPIYDIAYMIYWHM